MSDDVIKEAASTLHGQLQRGLGRAARRAAERRGAAELVYDCVRRDPRWDRQCERRSLYYARLMVDLEMPVGPLAEHLFDAADVSDEDGSRARLALEVLADLVRLSRREAAWVLRGYAEEGTHWFDAVEALAELRDPSLTVGLDELVLARCDDGALGWLVVDQANPVLAGWVARHPRMAAALARNRDRVGRRPERRAACGDRSDAELLELARACADESVAAIFELGRRRAPGLLDLAEELLPSRPSRWRGAMARVVREYGPETLPRARSWAVSRECRDVGLDIVARHGTRQDIPLLMEVLRGALDMGDWSGAVNPIEGLGRLRAGEAVPLLKAAWTESLYSYLRPRVLTALTRTAPHTAEAFTVEGLWDCEEGVREVAVRAVPRTEDTEVRLLRLQSDGAEDAEVRAAAAARLL
ncbi:hypothetical protein [Actinomadura atramentaria]|uniref:hypothetical protein n=1 Tax=Actinomadura atramentaria TaxID=1990 RepID=UPI001F0AF3EC|nr:hypothetical protein [Actinomadura atramentaria]